MSYGTKSDKKRTKYDRARVTTISHQAIRFKDMSNEVLDTKLIGQVSDHLYEGVTEIIDNARTRVAIYVNAHWNVGRFIIDDMEYQTYSAYGHKILATLSQTLTWSHFIELITIKDET